MALKNARGDVCLFCDDDETMVTDYANIILNAFSKLDDATGVVFNLDRINYTMKKRYYRITTIQETPKHRAYGSPMLAVKKSDIEKKELRLMRNLGLDHLGEGERILYLSIVYKNRV